jgi:hypothetical protein
VKPLYRRSEESYISDYRPVSLLTGDSKIFGRFMYKRMTELSDSYNVLSEHSGLMNCLWTNKNFPGE